jgi:hypothetical protein
MCNCTYWDLRFNFNNERVREWESERVREWESERVREWESERVREWESVQIFSAFYGRQSQAKTVKNFDDWRKIYILNSPVKFQRYFSSKYKLNARESLGKKHAKNVGETVWEINPSIDMLRQVSKFQNDENLATLLGCLRPGSPYWRGRIS